MSKTDRKSKQKQPPKGFDKNQWVRLNDTKIYESVEWDNNDVIQEVSISANHSTVEWRNIDWKTVHGRVFKLPFAHL